MNIMTRITIEILLVFCSRSLNVLIKQFGRDSLIIFSVAAVVGLSALLMGTHSAISLASGELNLSLGSVC